MLFRVSASALISVQILAVANDITHQAGAFGPKEDALFKAAAELSLEEKLPLVYLAANSGARIGVASEVRDLLRIQWLNEEDPTKGYEYLYLDDSDYMRVVAGNRRLAESVRAEPIFSLSGEKRWIIKDIIGLEDGLGVENLSGSGAIGSTFCKAWREGFTITMVSGRTVGIGAYLARLGRRCVQRKEQPIILTGYSALNKVLGKQVRLF
jgi:acetyl-CoA carboxylase/biotin carboxylase 1